MGALIFDGLCDGIFLFNQGNLTHAVVDATAFGILQAGRIRTSKTEYISCPGCGRTLFDLQSTIARVKAATSHLKGLKIGIMGCIVNGPGEMADADYGYVGAGRGKISLYKKKECIEKNIPEEEAVEKLIELIKANGDYEENSLKKMASRINLLAIFFKLFLLTEQPTHKVGIIESRIPATMITSRKLNVFHISTFLLQSPVCRTRTFRCNHIVSITVEIRNFTDLAAFRRATFTVPQIGTAAANISGKRTAMSKVPIPPIESPMI